MLHRIALIIADSTNIAEFTSLLAYPLLYLINLKLCEPSLLSYKYHELDNFTIDDEIITRFAEMFICNSGVFVVEIYIDSGWCASHAEVVGLGNVPAGAILRAGYRVSPMQRWWVSEMLLLLL